MNFQNEKQEAALKITLALAPMRKAQSEYAKWTLQQRAEALLGLAWTFEHRSQELAQRESRATGLSVQFLEQKSILACSRFFQKQAGQLLNHSHNFFKQYVPLGIVGILAPRCLGLRFICEHLAPALAAGNAVMVKVSSKQKEVADLLKELIQESGFPEGLVEVVVGSGPALGDSLVSHPSIQSISAAASANVAREIVLKCTAMNKKYFVESSSKNVLALVEGWQHQDFSEVFESVFSGWGQTGWNTNKIFVLEAHFADFKEKLKNWIEQLPEIHLQENEQTWSQVEELVQTLQQESGRSLIEWKKGRPLFIENLTNCSLFQQDNVSLPVFIVNVVKYPHEIQKWTDNQDTGFKFVIRGQVDKALSLAQKVRFGSIEVNSWMSPQADHHTGLKKSFYGLPEKSWDSRRFCDVKNLNF